MAKQEISSVEADGAVSGRALGIAAAAATVIPIVLVTLGFSLAFDSFLPRPQDVSLLIGFAIAGVVIATLTVFVLVLPLHWFLGQTGLQGVKRVLISGTIGAVPASGLWLLLQMLSNDPLSRALLMVWPVSMVAPGLIGAAVYCIASANRTLRTS